MAVYASGAFPDGVASGPLGSTCTRALMRRCNSALKRPLYWFRREWRSELAIQIGALLCCRGLDSPISVVLCLGIWSG
jgi:hypothetical protein